MVETEEVTLTSGGPCDGAKIAIPVTGVSLTVPQLVMLKDGKTQQRNHIYERDPDFDRWFYVGWKMEE